MEVDVKEPWIDYHGLPVDHRQNGKDRAVKRLLLKESDITDYERFEYYHLMSPHGENTYDGTSFND